jgi:single-stranded DNA-binding protein
MMRGEREIRQWLVDNGHISEAEKDTISIMACRTGDAGLVASSEQKPPEEGSEMSDMTNKVEIEGTVKWEPRVFEPREEGQKVIVSFAIEWERPKTDKKSVFHVKAFGDLAEKLKDDNLGEGDVVTVTGSLNESKWKDKKTDEWRNQIETWATKVEIGERAGGDDGGDFGGGDEPAAEDDDIPF